MAFFKNLLKAPLRAATAPIRSTHGAAMKAARGNIKGAFKAGMPSRGNFGFVGRGASPSPQAMNNMMLPPQMPMQQPQMPMEMGFGQMDNPMMGEPRNMGMMMNQGMNQDMMNQEPQNIGMMRRFYGMR